jgi:hypothetical protein
MHRSVVEEFGGAQVSIGDTHCQFGTLQGLKPSRLPASTSVRVRARSLLA